jgi:ABC-type thiamine transport system ATPase subunit
MEQLETLAHHIVQAEGICLEKFIARVNTTMKWYLEQFFPDQTVTMELDSERECKNGKIRHEICVHVLHRHHPCDLKALSGGEYDRCALAFMLAINELSHSPCLFLDESISSLDMSLSEDVLEVIKTKQSELHKIVLLVSHQANTGFFDHVITI